MSSNNVTDPMVRYTGPDFDEFCIDTGSYLPASRDRTPCVHCPLTTLCQAGFDEQVRRVLAGENPSLTDDQTFTKEQLSKENLFKGLSEVQVEFLKEKIG